MTLTVANPAVALGQLARQNVGAASLPGSANITHGFLYRTTNTRAQVEAAGYFNNARGRLTKGSIITAVMACDSTPPVLESYLVTAVTAGADITITRQSAAGLTDNTAGVTGATLALAACKRPLIMPLQLADLANAQVWKMTPGFRFKVNSAKLRIGKAATTGAKLATLTPQISGVAITGGVIATTSANATPTGITVDGTAITALNTGGAADTLEIAVSAVTAFVEGDGWVEFDVTNLDLADAIASLNAA